MSKFSIWKQKPWQLESLPWWKRLFKIPARFLMLLIYLAIIVGLIVAIVLTEGMWNGATYYYDFFGIELSVALIIVIASLILLPIGIYGTIKSIFMVAKFIRKEPFKLGNLPKVGIIAILIIGIVGVNYYMPQWPQDLGIANPSYGPYIAYHGENGMSISWDTAQIKASKLLWGTTIADMINEVTATETYWDTNTISSHHIVILSNLTPNATYYYSISDVDTKIYSFRMAPSPTSGEPVTFSIVADTQGGQRGQQLNVKWMLEKSNDLAFTCIAGDLVNRDDAMSEWSMLFSSKSYGQLATTIPWMNAAGNHETGASESSHLIRSNYKTFFQYNSPSNREAIEGCRDYGIYYSYNYSNVHMVSLDCLENLTDNSYFSTAQLNWLEADLARNPNMWKFVYLHYPIYSLGDFTGSLNLNNTLNPILEKYGVDAIFYGHDHHFEAFRVNAQASYGGTYHFVVGGGGGTIDPLMSVDKYGSRAWPSKSINVSESDGRFNTIEGSQYQLYGELSQHFMMVTVDGDNANFTAYRSFDGSEIVKYTVQR